MPADTKPEILTVSQVTRRVKDLLETGMGYVWMSGEISNMRVSPAGHVYFTLKDENSQIDAVMFRGKFMRVKFKPENGLEIIVYGLITVYEKRGAYQIVCDEMQPKGMGALQLAFEKLKQKLRDEGLFDDAHKKPLPLLPRRIGVVTSPTGAAIRDILNVLQRRFAHIHVVLFPARVQGDEAAEEIVEGIRALDAWGVDVIIVGRGGGSLEDLWPFNEEITVRAVYACQTPIISAVGHEIDYALTDFAADVRAPTPSAAAELVVQEQEALEERIRVLGKRMGTAMRGRLESARHRLAMARSCYLFQRPEELVRQQRQRLDDLRMRAESLAREQLAQGRVRMDRALRALGLLAPGNRIRQMGERLEALHKRLLTSGTGQVKNARNRLTPAAARLDALSPLRILGRGYALARKVATGEVVFRAAQLVRGELIAMRFGAGSATASVVDIKEETNGGT